MDLIQFGGLPQSLRKEQGLTQEQLAEQFGVARRTVSRWETGSNLPDIDVLIALADFYQIDLRKAARFQKTLPLVTEAHKEVLPCRNGAALFWGAALFHFRWFSDERRFFQYSDY